MNEAAVARRMPIHTFEDAPAGSKPFLQTLMQSSPGGGFLNLHGHMAHAPAVLAAYMSLRAVVAEHGSFDPKAGGALTLATAVAVGNVYMIGIASRLAQIGGWNEAQVAAMKAGASAGDVRIDVLIRLAREAAASSGTVSDATWKAALEGGWTDGQLADAFAYVGVTVFTGYFLNFAQTEPDASLW